MNIKSVVRSFRHLATRIILQKDSQVRWFLKHNKKYWQKLGSFRVEGNNAILTENVMGYGYWAMIISISAAIFASYYKAKIIYLLEREDHSHKSLGIFQKTFSRCNFFSVDELISGKAQEIDVKVNEIFESLETVEDILEIEYNGVLLGESIYDSILKHRQASVWHINEKTKSEIRRALRNYHAVQELLTRYNIKAGILSHSTCSYFGVIMRALIQQNVPVYTSYGGSRGFRRYDNFFDSKARVLVNIHVSRNKYNTLVETHGEALTKTARTFIEDRVVGKAADWDGVAAYSSSRKLYQKSEEFCNDYNLDSSKPCVFVMLHAMNDDPHVHPQEIFQDYYDWFLKTLKLTQQIKSVNWIYKQHPRYDYYPDDANLKGLFELVNEDNILYMDQYALFNTGSIKNIGHATVTCAGTAGLEFACFGVPGVIACRNHYSEHGLCYQPDTYEEYASLLNNITTLERPDAASQKYASTLFYLIYEKTRRCFIEGPLPNLTWQEMSELSGNEAIELMNEFLKGDEKEKIRQEIIEMHEFIAEDEKNSARKEDLLYLKI